MSLIDYEINVIRTDKSQGGFKRNYFLKEKSQNQNIQDQCRKCIS